MLHLALTITSGNKEAELAVGLELKELVMKYAKAMGVCDEDLGPWLTHRVSSFDPKVRSSSLCILILHCQYQEIFNWISFHLNSTIH